MARTRPTTVAQYIDAAPLAAQAKLRQLRAILLAAAPGATEAIKWGSPVLEDGRILFAYTAHRSHMNFMPTGSSLAPFKAELASYKTGKDTIQLPYDKPLPKPLIRKIALHRVRQVKEHGALWMARQVTGPEEDLESSHDE